jgi:hypothetical protein
MPIEIRELHIKAVIDGGGGKKPSGPAGAAEGEQTAGGSGQMGDELIDVCVEKVLEILKEKAER